MAFYKDPIIEESPTCIVCSDVMHDKRWEDGLVCSATCADLWLMAARGSNYDIDPDEALYA